MDLESPYSCSRLYEPSGGLGKFRSVVGSCNGLPSVRCYNETDSTIGLYNPCTQYYKKLPPSSREFNGRVLHASDTVFGFGYLSACDDFRVVRIVQEVHRRRTVVDVYITNSDSWASFNCHLWHYVNPYPEDPPPVLVNEVLHWIISASDFKSMSIVGYSLVDQCFAEVQCPDPYAKYGNTSTTLGVLRGCLSLLVDHDLNVDVWMMKSYGVDSSWINFCRISIAGLADSLTFVRLIPY